MDFTRTGDFLFVVCQVGAEQALKKEMLREHPGLRFAYSRPGFLTFKNVSEKPKLDPDFELKSVFARAWGITVGRIAADPDTEMGRLDLLVRTLKSETALPGFGDTMRLHVIERDHYVPGEEPPHYEYGVYAAKIEERLHQIDESNEGGLFYRDPNAIAGDRVLDLVLISETEWWLGFHVHNPSHSPFPGGRPVIEFPAEAPSRAFLKLEEAMRWTGVPMKAGDQAVEIGSAPGGASYALLQRGVSVVGIDPGEMDPVVMNFPGPARFQHLRKSVSLVTKDDLPASVDWLLLDMNVAPGVSLFAVERLVALMGGTLQGMILTVKLNDWSMADQVPSMIDYVRSMGAARVRARQLFHNRQEFVIYALMTRGMLKVGPENAN